MPGKYVCRHACNHLEASTTHIQLMQSFVLKNQFGSRIPKASKARMSKIIKNPNIPGMVRAVTALSEPVRSDMSNHQYCSILLKNCIDKRKNLGSWMPTEKCQLVKQPKALLLHRFARGHYLLVRFSIFPIQAPSGSNRTSTTFHWDCESLNTIIIHYSFSLYQFNNFNTNHNAI